MLISSHTVEKTVREKYESMNLKDYRVCENEFTKVKFILSCLQTTEVTDKYWPLHLEI